LSYLTSTFRTGALHDPGEDDAAGEQCDGEGDERGGSEVKNITAALASWFVERLSEVQAAEERTESEVSDLAAEVRELRAEVRALRQGNSSQTGPDAAPHL
jgi:hypothetical protein